MAKKKVKAAGKKSAKATRKSAKKVVKKVAKKKVAKKSVKAIRAVKKLVKKAVAKKKSVGRAVKKMVARPARQVATKKATMTRATRPKLPRRTTQTAPPPTPIAPPPPPVVVEMPPMMPPAPEPPPPPPPDFSPLEGGETESEADIGGVARGPAVGDVAPEFTLFDQDGKTHTLAQYHGRKVVLYFYPRDDTPGCTVEACGFRDRMGAFADRDAVVLGVSPDPVGSHQRFVQKYQLTFPLLADEGHAVAEKYGVWVEKTRMGKTSMGIARTTFVIDADGRVAHVFREVRPEGHEEAVLSKL
jgi:thioredoxin-dependent peroxiredoxin